MSVANGLSRSNLIPDREPFHLEITIKFILGFDKAGKCCSKRCTKRIRCNRNGKYYYLLNIIKKYKHLWGSYNIKKYLSFIYAY